MSIKKEPHATKLLLQSFYREFDNLQQEYEEIACSTSDSQLEVLTTEHIETSAQLNAACSDLAAAKTHAEAAIKGKEKEHKNQDEQLQFEMSVLKTRVGRVDEDADKLMGESKTKPYSKLESKRKNV